MRDEVNPEVAHERSDVTGPFAAALLGGIMLTLVAAALVLAVAFPDALRDRARGPGQPPPPEPRLQTDPAADLAALRAREQAALDAIGWVDRGRGIARIPIEDAMRRVAEHGIPGWPR